MAVLDTSMEKKKKSKKLDKKVLLAAQDIKISKALAGNIESKRNRALRKLHDYFTQRSKVLPFTEDDFKTIWKGLFYTMWMSDKPLVQEECAENISKLVHFETLDNTLLFFKAGLETLQNEWFGIDQLRLDKFLMLVRRFLRQTFFALKKHGFNKENVKRFNAVLEGTILSVQKAPPLSLFMHFTEIFFEELAKVSNGAFNPQLTTEFLKPFIKKLAYTGDSRQLKSIRNFVFLYLIRQHDLGLEYQEKYQVWKAQGFQGSINSIQKVIVDDDEEDAIEETETDVEDSGNGMEKPLDPRAGRVDVVLPQIKFSPAAVADALLEFRSDQKTTTISRGIIVNLAETFQTLAKGVYPLKPKKKQKKKQDIENFDTDIRKAAKRLIKFEQKIMGKTQNKKRKSPEDSGDDGSSRKKQKIDPQEDNQNGATKKKQNNESKQKQMKIPENVNSLVEKTHPKRKLQKDDLNGNRVLKKKVKETNSLKNQSMKIKLQNKQCFSGDSEVEYIFKRNSGTWVVTAVNSEENTELRTGAPSSKLDDIQEFSAKDLTPSLNGEIVAETPKNDAHPLKQFPSPQNSAQTFPNSPWDEPLKEGEYEIYIPGKKQKQKIIEDLNRDNQNASQSTLRGKSNASLKASSLRTPVSTPIKQTANNSSSKKVRINIKLNQSQEVHEHISQVMQSPQIPYDSSKKPGKPLLKTPVKSTPINPFYKLRF